MCYFTIRVKIKCRQHSGTLIMNSLPMWRFMAISESSKRRRPSWAPILNESRNLMNWQIISYQCMCRTAFARRVSLSRGNFPLLTRMTHRIQLWTTCKTITAAMRTLAIIRITRSAKCKLTRIIDPLAATTPTTHPLGKTWWSRCSTWGKPYLKWWNKWQRLKSLWINKPFSSCYEKKLTIKRLNVRLTEWWMMEKYVRRLIRITFA